MGKSYIYGIEHHTPFHILLTSSIVLIITSFLLPPTGVIDPSVIAVTGELLGWGALYVLLVAAVKGRGAKVTHGETSIEIEKKDDEVEE